MQFNVAHRAIISALFTCPLLTEHELASAVSNKTRTSSADAHHTIGRLLAELKGEGIVWAGVLQNNDRQGMWAACLTKLGRQRFSHAPSGAP